MPDTDIRHGHQWLRALEPATVRPASACGQSDGDDRPGSAGASEWDWITQREPVAAVPAARRRARARLWRWGAGAVSVTAIATGAVIAAGQPSTDSVAAPQTTTTAAATSTSNACAGLDGSVVTDTAGDTATVPGAIAAFQHAYYVGRDAAAALAVVGPEAGLDAAALAAGIASIPAGTTHCVAITPITGGAAEVHLVERHPDGRRIDYLQLVNTRSDSGRVLITNFQKRG